MITFVHTFPSFNPQWHLALDDRPALNTPIDPAHEPRGPASVNQGVYISTVDNIYGAWLLFFVSARTNKRHHHHYRVGEVDTPVVLRVEAAEGGDLAVILDGGEEVQGPRGWVLGEGAVDREGGVELP